MPRLTSDLEQRRLIWERILEAAMKHHGRTQTYGMQKVIASDSELGTAAVSKWATQKSRPESSTIRKLATLYGVSTAWLSGFEDETAEGENIDPIQVPGDSKEERDRIRLAAMDIAEKVVLNLKPDANVKEVLAIANRALELLDEGMDGAKVLGTIFTEVADSKAKELSHDP